MSTIVLENVVKRFGQVVAVSDVSFDVGSGVTGLLGPNGAGKSTIMKMMVGLLEPNLGIVRVFDRSLREHPDLYSKVGYCPETDPFYRYMTGMEFLSYNGRMQKISNVKKAARNALEQVDLLKQADKKIRAYSRGMKQRLKVAQCIMHDPEVIFLDEPLKGADPTQRKVLIDLIVRLGDEGRTVVVSSHILHEVERMASQIILIDRGRLMARGDYRAIREIMADRPHKVVVGSTQMHKLAGVLMTQRLVSGIEISDTDFVADVIDPNNFYLELIKIAKQEGIQVQKISGLDDDLESVFRYLVH